MAHMVSSKLYVSAQHDMLIVINFLFQMGKRKRAQKQKEFRKQQKIQVGESHLEKERKKEENVLCENSGSYCKEKKRRRKATNARVEQL